MKDYGRLRLPERLRQFSEDVTRLESHRDFVVSERESAEADAEKARYEADLQQKSSEVIKSWLDDMLRSNVDSIAELATSGLRHIIDDQELAFAIRQELKYNRLSMRFAIEHDGIEGNPMSSFGGGAVLVASLIVLTRYVSVSLVGRFHKFTTNEVAFTRMIFIQGAGTLVLSQFPAKFDPLRLSFTNPDIFTDLAIPIVIVSILFSSVVAPIIAHRQLLPRKKPEEAPVNGVKENGEEPSAVEPVE